MKRKTSALLTCVLLTFAFAVQASPYEDSLRAYRAEEDQWIREGTITPFTAIGQALLRDGQAVRVALAADTLLLDKPTADVGLPTLEILWQSSSSKVYVRTPLGGQFRLGWKSVEPVPMEYAANDTIRAERFLLQVYFNASGGRVMAFDPKYTLRKNFTGLHWFEPDERWKVEAAVEPIANGDTVAMTTSLGLRKYYIRHALLHFRTPDGSDQTLTLFRPASGDDYGFIPFTDTTTGSETYGGGRYLDVEIPTEGTTSMSLDFNRAYNPYCAYTHYYNCPIPPTENRLSVPISAGEKRYK
ncbi:MAG: DUF1684 domain-containing protein [bacterium]